MRNNKIYKTIFFISLLLFPSLILSKTKESQPLHSLKEISKKIRPSREEYKAAKRLVILYQQARQGDINKKLLKDTINLMKVESSLSYFNDWIRDLESISNTESLNALEDKCASSFQKNKTEELEAKLQKTVRLTCLKKYLSSSKFKNLQTLNSNTIQFLEKHMKYVIGHSITRDALDVFIQNTFKRKNIHRKVSEIISATYIIQNKEIPPGIVKQLYITENVTSHVQKVGFNNKETKKVLYNELKALSRNVFEASRDEELDTEIVKSKVENVLNFYRLNEEYLPKGPTWSLLIILGRNLLNKGFYAESKSTFKAALNVANEKAYHTTIFQLMWLEIVKENFQEAEAIVYDFSLLDKFNEIPSRLQFWVSYIFEKSGKIELAKQSYQKTLQNLNFDYYSIMSSKKIHELEGKKQNIKHGIFLEKFSNNGLDRFIPYKDLTKNFINSYKRLHLWSVLNQQELVESESRYLLSLKKSEVVKKEAKSWEMPDSTIKEQVTLMAANLLAENQKYLTSFSLIYSGLASETLSPNLALLGTLFPSPYMEQIKKIDDEIDPTILLSLIRQESAFNPRARSSVGARGLMQIMPATARQIQRRIAKEQLDDPLTNLKIGIKYFKRLLDKYSGNLVFTLAAYNAGEGNLKKWTQTVFKTDSMLHIIESIPYNETRKYVKLIFRNIFFYKFLNNHVQDTSDVEQIFDLKLTKNKT